MKRMVMKEMVMKQKEEGGRRRKKKKRRYMRRGEWMFPRHVTLDISSPKEYFRVKYITHSPTWKLLNLFLEWGAGRRSDRIATGKSIDP
jgi:hypothetical protein